MELKKIFQQAVQAVPYDLTSSGATGGSFEVNEDDYVDYSEEFTFPICRLFGNNLSGCCCVSLWYGKEDEVIEITGSFVAVLNEDWNSPNTIPEDTTVKAEYDLESNRWFFEPIVY